MPLIEKAVTGATELVTNMERQLKFAACVVVPDAVSCCAARAALCPFAHCCELIQRVLSSANNILVCDPSAIAIGPWTCLVLVLRIERFPAKNPSGCSCCPAR